MTEFNAVKSQLQSLLSSVSELLSELITYPLENPTTSLPSFSNSSQPQIQNSRNIHKNPLNLLVSDNILYIQKLLDRISKNTSRILVTGDLNSGKSTLVNALLRDQIVPALFCEVLNEKVVGKEVVHGIKNMANYSSEDSSTFEVLSRTNLRNIVEEEGSVFEMIKVYTKTPVKSNTLWHNSIIDVSLIDSPGLNIDSDKTYNLIGRQEEIDVVLFVVNAENHFTLSGRDFLRKVTHEKPHIFICINKFDNIKRRDRCRNEILSQISDISPLTSSTPGLIHFISARQILTPVSPDAKEFINSFETMEKELEKFVIQNRIISKLLPCKSYLRNLLRDVYTVCEFNHHVSSDNLEAYTAEMDKLTPISEKFEAVGEVFSQSHTASTIKETEESVSKFCVETIGRFVHDIEKVDVEWPGLIGVFSYTQSLRSKIFENANSQITKCVQYAQLKSTSSLSIVQNRLSSIGISTDIPSFQSDISMSLFYPATVLEYVSAIDYSAIFVEYLPSCVMICAGLFGVSYFKNLKSGFLGLGISGVGLFVYTLSDTQSLLNRTLKNSLKSNFKQFPKAVAAAISSQSKTYLSVKINELSKVYARETVLQFGKVEVCGDKINVSRECRDEFRALSTRVETLMRLVELVEIDH